ncbi:hypothetical protein VE03_06834 [Pseudogymnoascus sp. 23342-1-I1]|nr:hypothetical protein VE03_06834 [Pseudogymnoascus sp. 23342-1-I1]
MATHGMHSRLRRKAHPALAVRVPRHPEWDGPAEAASGGELEAEIVVKACDGVIVLMDYEEVAAGCEMAVMEAVEGGEGGGRRGDVRGVGGYLEVGEVIVLGAFGGGGIGVFCGAESTPRVFGSILLAGFPPTGSRW